MAKAVKKRIQSFSETMPKGFELTSIYDQGYESAVANQGFILNLIISVVTVVAILLFFIGFKNGLLIGSGLVFSIFATLIVMFANGIALQRMSLAAIIIAMGMLVAHPPPCLYWRLRLSRSSRSCPFIIHRISRANYFHP